MLNMTPAAILAYPHHPEATVSHALPYTGQACVSSLLRKMGKRRMEMGGGGLFTPSKGFFDVLPLPVSLALVSLLGGPS